MEAKDIKWCPQHGYPLPCYKCGMPLTQADQKDIYQEGVKAGRKEVFNWYNGRSACTHQIGYYPPGFCKECLEAKKKEWEI